MITVVNELYYFILICSKTRIAFENLKERLESREKEGDAANNTGIEYTQAAEVFILSSSLFLVQF